MTSAGGRRFGEPLRPSRDRPDHPWQEVPLPPEGAECGRRARADDPALGMPFSHGQLATDGAVSVTGDLDESAQRLNQHHALSG